METDFHAPVKSPKQYLYDFSLTLIDMNPFQRLIRELERAFAPRLLCHVSADQRRSVVSQSFSM